MNKPFEIQYKESLENVLKNGVLCENRTGIDTFAVQHQYFYIKDIMRHFPVVKGKKVYPLMALKEILWMMHGRTDVKWLQDRGVTYWNEWAGEDGTIGKSYGYQFRNFNGEDQLLKLFYNMLNNPESRRHIINLWNVNDLPEMNLAPCVYDFNFNCIKGNNEYKVNLFVHVRSNDAFLGVPYDFMYNAWFLHIVCSYLNMAADKVNFFKPNDIHYTADNYHIYKNHIEQVKQYIANVNENKNNVIDTQTVLKDIWILKDFAEEVPDFYSIDNFLNRYEDVAINKKYLCLEHLNKPDFEYGPIKADVAV